jgi:hypothetical protein
MDFGRKTIPFTRRKNRRDAGTLSIVIVCEDVDGLTKLARYSSAFYLARRDAELRMNTDIGVLQLRSASPHSAQDDTAERFASLRSQDQLVKPNGLVSDNSQLMN